jgi:anthranilate phosphoribosyltransferase
VRTLFNLLGPLTNPAGARHQLVGVYDGALLGLVAEALLRLGSARALVVHGTGGLDELAPDGATEVAELDGGAIRRYRLTPADFGLEALDAAGLAGGDARGNAEAARAILGGARGAARNAVVMSAAAALYVAGVAGLDEGARRAERLLDDGSAAHVLERLVEGSRAAR